MTTHRLPATPSLLQQFTTADFSFPESPAFISGANLATVENSTTDQGIGNILASYKADTDMSSDIEAINKIIQGMRGLGVGREDSSLRARLATAGGVPPVEIDTATLALQNLDQIWQRTLENNPTPKGLKDFYEAIETTSISYSFAPGTIKLSNALTFIKNLPVSQLIQLYEARNEVARYSDEDLETRGFTGFEGDDSPERLTGTSLAGRVDSLKNYREVLLNLHSEIARVLQTLKTPDVLNSITAQSSFESKAMVKHVWTMLSQLIGYEPEYQRISEIVHSSFIENSETDSVEPISLFEALKKFPNLKVARALVLLVESENNKLKGELE